VEVEDLNTLVKETETKYEKQNKEFSLFFTSISRDLENLRKTLLLEKLEYEKKITVESELNSTIQKQQWLIEEQKKQIEELTNYINIKLPIETQELEKKHHHEIAVLKQEFESLRNRQDLKEKKKRNPKPIKSHN